MKKGIGLFVTAALLAGLLAGCGNQQKADVYDGTEILLADDGITVNGEQAGAEEKQGVHVANDIVYYEEGHDFTYGEGTEGDAHSAEEAAAHAVVHITKPGQYILSGKLSRGQIAVDLGEDAEEDPDAVVTLVLDGVDVTCDVAPAIIFYNVYECGSKEDGSAEVDTSAAGANVIITDGSVNTVTGAYVARIYKPDSVELSEDGTEVADAKKLHKYDGAFYSKMSMNIDGGTGVLNIHAANEGLDTEMHLTINGGNIRIESGNDGINTNEDGISVTTINGGSVDILVNGATGEGDGIDSNGYLVINGGSVTAQACAFSGDAGIDSDMGIHINGGEVFATGNMLDQIGESAQNFAVFQFAQTQTGGSYVLKNGLGAAVAQGAPTNGFTYLIVSSEALTAGDYTLWRDDTQLQGASAANMGGGRMPMGEMPEGMTPPEGGERPESMTPPEGMEKPESMTSPEGMERPEDMGPNGEMPEEGYQFGGKAPGQGFPGEMTAAGTDVFSIADGGNYFQVVTAPGQP